MSNKYVSCSHFDQSVHFLVHLRLQYHCFDSAPAVVERGDGGRLHARSDFDSILELLFADVVLNEHKLLSCQNTFDALLENLNEVGELRVRICDQNSLSTKTVKLRKHKQHNFK